MHPFLTELAKRPLLMDGAMGTMLYAKGVSSEECLEYLLISKPHWITEIHTAYAAAGADVLLTHTFGASRPRLEAYGMGEKVRDLNFRAVKLLRDVREVAGRAIFIAGDMGPLGKSLAPKGDMTPEAAFAAFQEQILALWEAGADLLHMETFSELAELEIAVRAAKATCDLPIVASMSYGQDGLTHGGQTPEEVVASLQALGVDVIGANCSVGPASLQQTLGKLHAAGGDFPLSVKPNAGFPTRVEGRFYYPSSPEYFGEAVQNFLKSGAKLVGGCCGTTPMHLRAMRQALDAAAQGQTGPASSWAQVAEPLPEMWVSGGTDIPADDEERPTGLLQKLNAGNFVISVEVDPPRSFTAQKQIEGARHAKLMGADAINVADSPMARVRMGALALCTMIQQQVDIETILHFTTRDRSLMGLQADLIGAHAIGVRNILALTGDPPSLGDSKGSTAVYDVDSIGLVRIIDQFNQGYDQAGKQMGRKGSFTIAVACDPTRPNLEEEVDRFQRKVSGGAHFTMTQPIYDPQLWLNFLHLYEQRHGPFPVPVLIGVLPLQSHKHASFLHHEVPGITLSEEARERMRLAGADGRMEGVRMAQELLLELKELPHVQGVYLMPSFGRYEVACQVLEVLTPAERGVA
ncbi:MAG: bifunctional homocysteine S-methyltransferase/methylenetetrahydrofolate reductase [Caldilineaceae bacterium]|nr:bifunctional homocysteine S-methyltransferase/methylenetetrahydrofolate reductase [Caldilineaceae bacterium]MBP8109026.1 bifunctional homocysteine S-methyltransferase/methylenetetrahydrofolate reductase [Caldilineaceae bacterium]MBP8124623.1 bifunctional homocysteine S-methyltransferase/methylenetetrahydrofolate reductase [Caldilineaceae bacterium]MBP9074000.1 bifunctional homocysteine S-methyltransferase/methylenetetrahydrofolate reductase [Caldilineaceae bacterium]